MVAPERDAYLARLGLDAEPPSVEALFRIHRARVERVPYETLWIQLGERWGVDTAGSVARIALRRRGGYCFHLNGALHERLPLLAGAYDQSPFHLVLSQTPGTVGDWHLSHDPAGGFAGMAWRSAPVEMDAFAERHAWLSTSPDSGFVRVLTAQRRDASPRPPWGSRLRGRMRR